MQPEQAQELEAIGGFLQVLEARGRAASGIAGGVSDGHIIYLLAGDLRAVPGRGQGGEGGSSALPLQGSREGSGVKGEAVGYTENHYYEIVNKTGKSVFIHLALSSKEMPEEQILTSNRINDFYPCKTDKENWQWRIPFKTKTLNFDDVNDKEALWAKLDTLLPEIQAFENDLRSKL